MDQEPELEPLQLQLELLEPLQALQDMDQEPQPLEQLESLELPPLAELQELLHMANNKELHMEQVDKLEHQVPPPDMEHQVPQVDMEHLELPLDMEHQDYQDLELLMDNPPPAVFPHQDKDSNHHIKEPLEEQEHSVVQVQDHQVDQATISKLKILKNDHIIVSKFLNYIFYIKFKNMKEYLHNTRSIY